MSAARHGTDEEQAAVQARPLWVVSGVILLCVLPMLGLLVARGPVDGAGDTAKGFWGSKTATVNWCEADYAVTPYIAEFWNSLSSLIIFFIALYGILVHWRRAEWRYTCGFGALGIIGLGSCAFHGTLLRSMQLLDELPMIWANSMFIYILVAMEDEQKCDPRVATISTITLVTVLMTLAVIFLDQHDQNVFLLCYGGGVVYIFFRSRWFDGKYNSKGTVMLLETSIVFYGGGFLLWLIDRNFCPVVRSLYLHVIWHICAGIGTFTCIIFWLWVRCEFLGLKPSLRGSSPATRWIEVTMKDV